MAIPRIQFNVNPNGIPISPPRTGQVPLILGMSATGPSDTAELIASFTQNEDNYTAGPLPELVGAMIDAGVPEVIACRIFSGSVGTFTHTGSGSPSLPTASANNPMGPYGSAVSAGVTSGILVSIVVGGALGTATYKYSLNGGITYSAAQTLPVGGVVAFPNTGVSYTFAAGTYVAGDTYTGAITAATGSIGSVTQSSVTQGTAQGEGGITVSGSPVDTYEVIVQIVATGACGGTAGQTQGQFVYSLDGAQTWSNPVGIPPQGTGIHIGENAEIEIQFSNDGVEAAIALIPSTTSPDGISVTANAVGTAYNAIQIVIGMGGGAGTTASASWSGNVCTVVGKTSATNTAIEGAINSASGTVPLSGVTAAVVAGGSDIGVAFSGNLTGGLNAGTGTTPYFIQGDQYAFTTTGPVYSTTDLSNAFQAVLSQAGLTFGFIVILGRPATATAAYTLATTVDALMTDAAADYAFARVFIETPPDTSTASIDSSLQSAFANPDLPSYRVCVGAGDIAFSTPDGYELQRCVTWGAAIRCALSSPGIDLAWVGAGPLNGVSTIYRDESVTGGLDNLGFITARTFRGKQGFFLTSAQIMGAIGNDFQYLVAGRVMDEACTTVYPILLNWLNAEIEVDPSDGTITEDQARTIDGEVNKGLYDDVVSPGDASGAQSLVDRTSDILATSTLIDNVAIVPNGYARQIEVNIGFAIQLSNAA
jgi:hypothetical protein